MHFYKLMEVLLSGLDVDPRRVLKILGELARLHDEVSKVSQSRFSPTSVVCLDSDVRQAAWQKHWNDAEST